MKLIAMSLALVLSITVVLMSTYAWLVLSNSPAVTGIHVAIGGGNTILTAPNIREVAKDGTVYHYPGRFSDKLNFAVESNYEYLQQIGKLAPVSTTNGVDWFLPVYYSEADKEVQEGWVSNGALKDVSEFRVDSELAHANLSPTDENKEKIQEGSYVYLDFWVVSPGGDFTLRVSTGVEDPDDANDSSGGGSFVIDLMVPEETENGYVLTQPKSNGAGAVRVGFLANNLSLVDETMQRYIDSDYFDERFIKLKGMYQEPNSGTAYLEANKFVIYEPNCDFHPTDAQLDGSYVETKPLTLVNGNIRAQRAQNITAQKKSTWVPSQKDPAAMAIAEEFHAPRMVQNWDDRSVDEVLNLFYGNHLQGQLARYVNNGGFIGSTKNLNALLSADKDGVLPREVLSEDIRSITEGITLDIQGATEDVSIIKLERNVPQRIRMFIWLEGQDVDCVDKVNSARFAVNIEFAGGSE